MLPLDKTKTNVLFATFSPWNNGIRLPTNGSVEPLRDFLITRVNSLVLLDQPIPGSDFVMPRIELYKKSKNTKVTHSSIWIYLLLPFLKLFNKSGTRIVFKIRDFFSVIDTALRFNRRYDIFIGLESINTIAGIIMRKFGFITTVVYYVSDYSPHRYSNKLFNKIYLMLDVFCATHTDYIWDVSDAMQPARIKAGLDPNKSAPVVHVPNGLFDEQIPKNRQVKKYPKSVAYMGTLGKVNGIELLLESFLLVTRKIPTAKLYIIGGKTDDVERLHMYAQKLGVSKHVKFYGFVPSADDMTQKMMKCCVAVIPYRAFSDSARWYADANKIRAYAAAGLPIVTTHVPPLGKKAKEAGAAIVVKDTKRELADGMIKLLSDKKLYLQMKKNAIRFAEGSTWDKTFANAFAQM